MSHCSRGLKSFFLILMFLLGLGPRAQAQSITQARYSREVTSDQFERNSMTAGWRNHRRDLFWPYANEGEDAVDYGFELSHHQLKTLRQEGSGVSGLALVGMKHRGLIYGELALGAHQLNSASKPTTTLGVGRVKFQSKLRDDLDLGLLFERDYVYQDLLLPAGLSDNVYSDRSKLHSQWRMHQSVRSLLAASFHSFSDGNRRSDADISVLYGISTGEPWIWVGLGVSQLKFEKTTPGYWSPLNFVSSGFRSEASFQAFKRASVFGGINYNWIRENDGPQGTGHFISIGVQWGERDLDLYRLGFSDVKTQQSGSAWTSYQVFFEAQPNW